MLRPSVTQEWVDEGELLREQTKNRRWRRPYDVLAEATHGEVILTLDDNLVINIWGLYTTEAEVEVQVPVSMIGVARELDYFSAHIRLRGARQVRGQDRRWDFRGVIDPLLSWSESIGRKSGRGGEECRGKLQVPRQGGRTMAKELHKTGVNGLIIKIAESEGLRVDAGVLDQRTK
ncbi:hypothetical protein BHM03_00062970 [Ensete ventricosum]|nr:hypothetical protein BHM03_00062970 [Ensete ventricosum]